MAEELAIYRIPSLDLLYSEVFASAEGWTRCVFDFTTPEPRQASELAAEIKDELSKQVTVLYLDLWGTEDGTRWRGEAGVMPLPGAVYPSFAWIPFLGGIVAGLFGMNLLGSWFGGGGTQPPGTDGTMGMMLMMMMFMMVFSMMRK